MELDEILKLLESGQITAEKAREMLALYTIEEMENMARLDVGRGRRRGIPEVIYAESKELADIKAIIQQYPKADPLVVSRIRPEHLAEVISFAEGLGLQVETGRNSSTILLREGELPRTGGAVGILTAGTSDIPVAEEARLVCSAMGCRTICRYDVGVAGLHRMFPALKEVIEENVDCIVVAAGMEGALATLVASSVDVPVIGVPVSVGYGYGAKGVAALAAMLQSCALGLTVVNIDGGVAAGAAAAGVAKAARRRSGRSSQRTDGAGGPDTSDPESRTRAA